MVFCDAAMTTGASLFPEKWRAGDSGTAIAEDFLTNSKGVQ